MKSLIEQQHIAHEHIAKLAEGECGAHDKADMLSHIAECPECAAEYAAIVEKKLISPPESLSKDIINVISSRRSRRGMMMYKLKVGFVCALSVIVMISVPFNAHKSEDKEVFSDWFLSEVVGGIEGYGKEFLTYMENICQFGGNKIGKTTK